MSGSKVTLFTSLVVMFALGAVVAPGAADAAPRKKKKVAPAKAEPAPAPAPEPDPAPEPEPAKPLDTPASPDQPLASSGSVSGGSADVTATAGGGVREKKRKRFFVRAGVARISPLTSSKPMELADVDGAASLALKDGPIEGSGSDVDGVTIFAATLGYHLPFGHDHWALETVLGLPFKVKFTATGTLANESIAPTALGIPTGVGPLGPQLGEAKAAPPMLTLVYNLMPHSAVQPYLGAGAAVMFTFDAQATNPMLTAISKPDMSIAPAPGLVLQGGLEAKLYKNVYARLDVKFIAFMLARAEVHHIVVQTPGLPLFDTVEVGTAKLNMWINPLIVQGGLGLDF